MTTSREAKPLIALVQRRSGIEGHKKSQSGVDSKRQTGFSAVHCRAQAQIQAEQWDRLVCRRFDSRTGGEKAMREENLEKFQPTRTLLVGCLPASHPTFSFSKIRKFASKMAGVSTLLASMKRRCPEQKRSPHR